MKIYIIVFLAKLKNLYQIFSAKYILFDMEKATINYFKKCFLKNSVLICLFHLGQAWWRSIQTNEMSTDYKKMRNIRNSVRQLASLTFIPKTDVDLCYKY
ncbi:hypothetical protein DMUE_6013 [Dictyocoela muelleri]|nr:hypothetical protein DMUE_6013 [Dictyocoela muelleri]